MVYRNASKGGDSAATFVDLFAEEKDFAADTKQAAVRIGSSKITPKTETEYEVVGASLDGTVRWFLTYTRLTYPGTLSLILGLFLCL